MLLGPFVPGTGTKATHEEDVLHARVNGEVEDMQAAPNAERIYDFSRNNGESPRSIATLHPLLLLLLSGQMFFTSHISLVLPLSVSWNAAGCWLLASKFQFLMTGAVNLLGCGWLGKNVSFLKILIHAHRYSRYRL